MKYTNKDIIRSGEKKLIRFLAKHLDFNAVKESIQQTYQIDLNNRLEHRSGNIVIHNEEIAYQLDFDMKVNLSVLLDRDGELLSIRSPQLTSREHSQQPASPSNNSMPEEKEKSAETAKKAAEIAEMISDINK